MQVVSIDIETTGLDPAQDQILQVGALAFDLTDEKEPSRDQCPTFNIYVKHDRYSGDAYALAMNAWILDILAIDTTPNICPALEVPARLLAWLTKNKINIPFIATGKNFDSFDRQFLNKYVNFIKHRSLDPGPMYTRVTDSVPPDLTTCCKRANVASPVLHEAVADAEAVAKCVWKYFHNK